MADLTPDILKELASKAEAELAKATDSASLEAWRIEYLGRQGHIPQLLRQGKELPEQERKKIGKLGNEIRQRLEVLYAQHSAKLVSPTPLASPKGSATPPTTYKKGHLHPLTQSLRRAQDIFAAMGFQFL